MSKIDKDCEFRSCESDAFRHLSRHHFCNEHNWYLRVEAQSDRPDDLQAYVEEFI